VVHASVPRDLGLGLCALRPSLRLCMAMTSGCIERAEGHEVLGGRAVVIASCKFVYYGKCESTAHAGFDAKLAGTHLPGFPVSTNLLSMALRPECIQDLHLHQQTLVISGAACRLVEVHSVPDLVGCVSIGLHRYAP
jgi:hypothetical protein